MLYVIDSPELREFEKKMHDEAVKTDSKKACFWYNCARGLRNSCYGKFGGKR